MRAKIFPAIYTENKRYSVYVAEFEKCSELRVENIDFDRPLNISITNYNSYDTALEKATELWKEENHEMARTSSEQ